MILRIGYLLLALLAGTVPLAAEPFHHPFGEWREYNQDWLAACPDAIDENSTDFYGVSCFASTGSAELNGAGLPGFKLTLLRNRLSGVLDIAFVVAADGIVTDTGKPLQLSFGADAPLGFDFSTDLETRYNTVNQFYVVDPVRRDALLALLKSRNAVTARFPVTLAGGRADTRAVRFSLRGVSASLDFMATYARKLAQY